MIDRTQIALDQYYNSCSATYNESKHLGAANAWGNSFPAEELMFGEVMTVGSVPFRMPLRGGQPDNIEALGQLIELPDTCVVRRIAVLCYGEMGDQALAIAAEGIDGKCRRFTAVARGWLVERDTEAKSICHVCSHLHYNDGFEFSALRPVLWCWKSPCGTPMPLKRLALGINPLFHIIAITCFCA